MDSGRRISIFIFDFFNGEKKLHAATFQPLSDSARQALLDRTAEVAKAGSLELYKNSNAFDSTAAHPEWLG